MARRLLDGGYRVAVYNRTPDRARPLLEAGASLAPAPRAPSDESHVVFYSLTTWPCGTSSWARRGSSRARGAEASWFDLSTVLPATSQTVSSAAHSKDVAAIDAPVSGSTPQAEQGTLVMFVGGDRSAYESIAGMLDVLGRHVHIGGSGAGTTMKLVTNTLLGPGVEALAEALALGRRAGLETVRLLDALQLTSVVSPAQKAKFENIKRGEYPPAFALRMMSKVYGLILHPAESCSVPMPATAAAKQVATIETARNLGREEDFSAVNSTIQELSGVTE
jgi:3-hydroxyisobutyrate dehydrogenase-like beta-hydroxyacid dehydrogenase